MRFEFTPGAERALAAAGGWISCEESDALHLPEVLLGLVAEPECRSALILADFQIDSAAVRQTFPTLRRLPSPQSGGQRPFSDRWVECLNVVESLLIDYPRPLELATEHLLLGLVATDNEVSSWLAKLGLDAERLEAEVHRLSGHEPGPLSLDIDLGEPERGWTVPTGGMPGAPDTPPPDEQEQTVAMRILDAAANRAGEGLRVIEDYLRFALDDRHLTRLCKSLRHDLTAALAALPARERHAARDTQADVGTSVTLPAEQSRGDARAVLAASFKRVEQSLRSLEEYGKLVAPEMSAAIEQLRYRTYTLERAVDVTNTNLERLATARLYVLVDGGKDEAAFARLIESLVEAGVSVLQLRDKHLTDRELLARARRLRKLTEGTDTLFVMNDRPDLAVLSGADGVHVGQEELTVKDVRRILGPRGLVGVSTHSLEQAEAAVLDGADYIGVGPTFPSGTKQFAELKGPELLRAVSAEIRLPAFAIGGITPENLDQVLAAGFKRIAVSGAVTGAADPGAAAKELMARLA